MTEQTAVCAIPNPVAGALSKASAELAACTAKLQTELAKACAPIAKVNAAFATVSATLLGRAASKSPDQRTIASHSMENEECNT